jgi:hypothetical protein
VPPHTGTLVIDSESFSFDVDYPLDVDDEYWDTGNPQTDFKQPPGKPSKIAMYISLLSLERIVASAIMNVVSCSVPRLHDTLNIEES